MKNFPFYVKLKVFHGWIQKNDPLNSFINNLDNLGNAIRFDNKKTPYKQK